MVREEVIISNLDLKILNYLKDEHIVNEILNNFSFNSSQCRRHIKRIEKFLTKRTYGNFRFFKLNELGLELIKILIC